MSSEFDIHAAVNLELLRLGLRNSGRSIPLQILAVLIVVGLAISVDAFAAAAVSGAVGLSVATWRAALARQFGDGDAVPKDQIASATLALEGNAALAGLLWAICAVFVYPLLPNTEATAFVVIIIGSMGSAAMFMSLVGRSFLFLVTLSFGSLVAVSLLVEEVRSLPVAALVALLGYTMVGAAREVRQTTMRAIRHSFEADRANASLTIAKQAADEANTAKSRFLAMMSHEIRTPMIGVLGAIELLRHSKLDAHQRQLARTAASSGKSLMNLLNDVLDHSKIEAGRFELTRSAFSIRTVATSVIDLFAANAEAKGIDLQLECKLDREDWVLSDAQRLKQVLLNLVGNAIKFTEKGRVCIDIDEEMASQEQLRVKFTVRDSGIGIAPEMQQNLFRPFQQLGDDRSPRREGTGLGLAISQSIVKAMGGQIVAKSQPGQGSSFEFTLTLDRDPTSSHEREADSAFTGLGAGEPLHGCVMVVEDNDVSRMIACEMLASLGLDTIEARDGGEALARLKDTRVDLVLMDGHMPGMDGYQATIEWRKIEADLGRKVRLPVLAFTADAFEDDIAKARRAGMDGHLTKPYTREQLKALLNNWL
jgi:two-component system, sensor histidine kinase